MVIAQRALVPGVRQHRRRTHEAGNRPATRDRGAGGVTGGLFDGGAGGDLGANEVDASDPLAADLRPDAAWRLSYAALDVACALVGAESAALFANVPARLHLLALHDLSQEPLDLVAALWGRPATGLVEGQLYGHDEPALLVVPCSDDAGVIGLLVLRTPPDDSASGGLVLVPLARVLAGLLRRIADAAGLRLAVGPEPSARDRAARREPDAPTSAMFLEALLEANEWNVSRVARLLGVTRMTVYNRLRRDGIVRRRVRKTRRQGRHGLPGRHGER